MSMYARVVLSLCAIALLAGCATQASGPGARGEVPVHVVTHGWHTGLAMQASDIAFGRWPALPHPARVRYIEVGWGDRDYRRTFPASEVVELHVSRTGFERLLA